MTTERSSSSRVALALGSGGARGYAHIGVIEELRARGHRIVGVSGSSMGALVGGVEAAGKLDDYAEWARSLTQRSVLRLLDPALTAPGVLRAEKIIDAVGEILGDATIETLPIPYTAVATDLIAGKSVWLQRGPVDAAIRASIAIPGVIAPHLLDGRWLADGGILDPLPMAPIAAVNADVTIAVSLAGSEAGGTEPQEPRPTAEWVTRLTTALLDTSAARTVLDRFGAAGDPDAKPEQDAGLDPVPGPDPDTGPDSGQEPGPANEELVDSTKSIAVPRLGAFEVMNRTIDIAQAALARHILAAYPPDVLIEVPRSVCRSLDFHRAAEVIDTGRELAAATLDEAGLT